MQLPKSFRDAIDNLKVEEVFSWMKETIYFLTSPKIFFSKLYQRSYLGQVLQLAFYSLVLVLISWFSFDNTELRLLLKPLFSILLLTIPFIILNTISLKLIDRKNYKFWKVLSFTYVTWILFTTPAVTFLSLFVANEIYVFYFASNFLSVTALFYSLFLIWYIFFDDISKIIYGYLLNILVINIFYILPSISPFDTYSKINTIDPILNELYRSLGHILTYEGKPFTRVEKIYLAKEEKVRGFSLLINDTRPN